MNKPKIKSNGNMLECLEAECPSSCCNGKEDASFFYNTAYLLRKETIPKMEILDQIGIRVSGMDNTHIFIRGCQKNDGNCKLEDKPDLCKLHPFRVTAEDPLDLSCPQAIAIASIRENVDQALKIRNELGYFKEERTKGKG